MQLVPNSALSILRAELAPPSGRPFVALPPSLLGARISEWIGSTLPEERPTHFAIGVAALVAGRIAGAAITIRVGALRIRCSSLTGLRWHRRSRLGCRLNDAEADKQLTVSRRWRISTGNWVDRGRQAQFAVDYDVACRQCGECLHQARQTIGPFSATFREESDAALSQPGGFLFCGEPPLGREVIDHSGEMLT